MFKPTPIIVLVISTEFTYWYWHADRLPILVCRVETERIKLSRKMASGAACPGSSVVEHQPPLLRRLVIFSISATCFTSQFPFPSILRLISIFIKVLLKFTVQAPDEPPCRFLAVPMHVKCEACPNQGYHSL